MSWGARIFRLRLRMVAASPMLWVLLLVAVLFSLLPIQQFRQAKRDLIPVAVVNHYQGVYSGEFISLIGKIENLTIYHQEDLSTAQKKLSIGEYEAVIEILDNFSDQVIDEDYAKAFKVYLSPSSSVGVFLVEVLTEKYVEIWGQELVLNEYRQVLTENDLPFSEAGIDELRQEMIDTIPQNALVYLDIDRGAVIEQPELENTAENTLYKSALYYCALVIIFIFLSCRWVIDLRLKGIGVRMHSMGITSTVVTLASSLAMAVLCEALLFVSLLAGTLLLHTSFMLLIKIMAASLLYFIAAIGISITLSSMLKESISLMLISPIAVLVNSLFGGMLSRLPTLTTLWQRIVFALPGRQLTEAFSTGSYWPLLLGALIYSALGLVAVNFFGLFKTHDTGDS